LVTGVRCLMETLQRGGIVEARDIDSERLSLGRGADSDIRLQSRLAGLNHAVIEQGNDGKPRIRAVPPNLILHNGREPCHGRRKVKLTRQGGGCS
jgi:hypothetical protein